MNQSVKFIRQHPVVTIVYLMYTLLWLGLIRAAYIQDQFAKVEGIHCGMGLIFLFFFTLIVAAVYLAVTLLQAVLTRRNRDLYLILALFILIPAAIITVIGYL